MRGTFADGDSLLRGVQQIKGLLGGFFITNHDLGTRPGLSRVPSRLIVGGGRMNTKLLMVLAAGGVLLTVSDPMLAHHAGSVYDREHAVTVTGTVTEYLFTNPHVQIHFEVKDDDGNVVKWVAESASPQRLYKFGWNAKTLKVGDKVTVTGAPAKDGRKFLSIVKLVGGNAPSLTQGAE